MSNVAVDDARGNLLLASLPPTELGELVLRMRRVRHRMGEVLYEASDLVPRVNFPLGGVISLVTVTTDGAAVEVATVGDEGMVGVPVFLGSGQAGNVRAVCQVPGETLALSSREFRHWLASRDRLPEVLSAYVEFQFIEAAQSVACNRLHPVELRAARWLLLSHDRAETDEFPMTHEFLAQMLGVRRESVTLAAGILQRAGLISYRRGRVSILDRPGLEQASCECYRVIRQAQQRLLPPPPSWRRGR